MVESHRSRTAARWTRHFISVLEEEKVAYNLVLTPARVYIVPRITEDVPRRMPFPGPLQGKGIGGLEVAGVFIAEQRAMYDCLTRDAYWRLLQETTYSQRFASYLEGGGQRGAIGLGPWDLGSWRSRSGPTTTT